jgi:hypothetical protein
MCRQKRKIDFEISTFEYGLLLFLRVCFIIGASNIELPLRLGNFIFDGGAVRSAVEGRDSWAVSRGRLSTCTIVYGIWTPIASIQFAFGWGPTRGVMYEKKEGGLVDLICIWLLGNFDLALLACMAVLGFGPQYTGGIIWRSPLLLLLGRSKITDRYLYAPSLNRAPVLFWRPK